MPELRFDQTTGDWVVFAPLRQLRPRTQEKEISGRSVHDLSVEQHCPFCPGNESMTPNEIDAIRDGSNGNWQVRVIPNKFPALMIEEDERRIDLGEVFHKMGGCGAHEVVVESPEHTTPLASQPVEQIERVLRILQRRYRDLLRDHRFQAIILFKNHGENAGTSLRHPHWQIIATPVVPRMLRQRYAEAANFFDRTGNCLHQVILNEELAAQKRVISSNQDFVAFLPFASHLPFETWIVPRQFQSSFGRMQEKLLRPLAEMIQLVLARLFVGLENPDFNLTIDTAARGEEDQPSFCWHIRILPRLSTAAGFELGSGMSINTVLPEDAAKFLRAGSGE